MPDNHILPPSLVETIAGFTAGVVSTLALHPLDIVKTRLQVDRAISSRLVGSSFRVARSIARNEGVATGFYRGLTPNIVGSSVSWGLYFLWYGKIKDTMLLYRGLKLNSVDYFVASGAAGFLTAVLTNPIWVIKTRMLSTGRNAPGAYRSVIAGVRQIMRTEGLPGFYRGLVPSIFGVSHGAFQFMAYERLKKWRADPPDALRFRDETDDHRTHASTALGSSSDSSHVQGLTNMDFILLPALSKIFAGSITYPYQVLRSRLQTYDAAETYKGTVDVIGQIWKREGIEGFYKGLGPNLVRVLPSTCVTFLVYENMRMWLNEGEIEKG